MGAGSVYKYLKASFRLKPPETHPELGVNSHALEIPQGKLASGRTPEFHPIWVTAVQIRFPVPGFVTELPLGPWERPWELPESER